SQAPSRTISWPSGKSAEWRTLFSLRRSRCAPWEDLECGEDRRFPFSWSQKGAPRPKTKPKPSRLLGGRAGGLNPPGGFPDLHWRCLCRWRRGPIPRDRFAPLSSVSEISQEQAGQQGHPDGDCAEEDEEGSPRVFRFLRRGRDPVEELVGVDHQVGQSDVH